MVTIRPVSASDYEAWRPLWDAYVTFYESSLPDAVTADVFSRLVAGHGVFGAMAWSENGEAVGLVHWLFHPSTWSLTDYCYLEDLYVSPAARGLGVGRALIDHVNEAARASGAHKVYWLTHETNTTAQALYDRVAERTGFIHFEQPLAD
ncbi:N-acetyltransferase family protein [Demequina sp.]|uniref:GNAT family N-acetyltransferase n=1 Tax=Demequina sp. TaxID=2050685 RepID=UPI003D0D3CE0